MRVLAAKLVDTHNPRFENGKTATTESPLGSYPGGSLAGRTLGRQEEPNRGAGGRKRAEGGRPGAGMPESRRYEAEGSKGSKAESGVCSERRRGQGSFSRGRRLQIWRAENLVYIRDVRGGGTEQ